MKTQITVGCDPEVFLQNPQGKFISSVGRIGGSKEMPLSIGRGCAIQEDNVAVEFNTPPCIDAASFVDSIQYNLDMLTNLVRQQGLSLSIVPSAVFSDDELDSEGAQVFGCEPDFNAWKGGEINPKPRCDNKQLRSAGGHIHIGNVQHLDPLLLVQAMDAFVGMQMLDFDKDQDRRKLYGNPGAFRKKPYGVEYRTASNRWIETPELRAWAFAQTQKAVEFVESGHIFTNEQGERIQQCIKEGDIAMRDELNKELGIQ